jgi:hypothetical protein
VRGDLVKARPIVEQSESSGVLWRMSARFPRAVAWKKERGFLAREAPDEVYRLTEVACEHVIRLSARRGGAFLSRRRAVEHDDDLAGAAAAFAPAEKAIDAALGEMDRSQQQGNEGTNDRSVRDAKNEGGGSLVIIRRRGTTSARRVE